ncbi:MAG: PH domain-containing protein [Planctomycetes bacterium]|nr:PH domain-containing protein [Planctomycetota bacterium]
MTSPRAERRRSVAAGGLAGRGAEFYNHVMVPAGPTREPGARPQARSPQAAAPSCRPMSGSAPGGMEEGIAHPRIIAPTLLLPAEIIVMELKPSLWYVAFVSLPVAAAGLALAILALTTTDLPESLRRWGIVIGVWATGLRVALGFLQWLGRTYVLTDRRIITQVGVVNVSVETAGLEDIENTFVGQAAAQRLLGIGTLFFRLASAVRCATLSWDHVPRPAEVHAKVIAQIERWKRAQSMLKQT